MNTQIEGKNLNIESIACRKYNKRMQKYTQYMLMTFDSLTFL
jgi:hypothetical protein